MKPPTLILEEFDALGIQVHGMPNAIGMWPNEQECLVWLAQNAPDGDFLEIGSFCGGSACLLGLVAKEKGNHVFSIDIDFDKWKFYDFNIKRAGVEHLITKIEVDSNNLFTNPKSSEIKQIGVGFIDGYHSFKQVYKDFIQIKNYIVDGGFVCFHDTSPFIYNSKYREQLQFDIIDYNNDVEDFRLDEALVFILRNHNEFEFFNVPAWKNIEHFEETGLNKWQRGTTSPFNSLSAIRKKK